VLAGPRLALPHQDPRAWVLRHPTVSALQAAQEPCSHANLLLKPNGDQQLGGVCLDWGAGALNLKYITQPGLQEYKKAQANPAPSSKLKLEKAPKPIGKGDDTIYLGYGKS
jgi:hypothetical protein